MLRFLCVALFALSLSATAQDGDGRASDPSASGGRLLPEQAAFDVTRYDLRLDVDPEARRIAGSNTVHARVVFPTGTLVLDLDTTFAVTGVREEGGGALPVERHGGRLWIDLGRTAQPGEDLAVTVDYEGAPRVAPMAPWEGGFVWVDRPDGTHWVGVANQGEGADLWWPVKDHPSDEPESMRVRITVPDGHVAVTAGRLETEALNEGGTVTYEWVVSNPINNYGLSLYVGPYERLEADYTSVTGEPLPYQFWVLPEDRPKAERQLPQFVDHVRFMEETFGPYPFRTDKLAAVHAPYLGMEHQSAIAYGDTFENNAFGFDWLHLHELAHEWFGNLVTVPDWSHFWVHEGFAMYVEALYAERLGGPEAYRRYMRERMRGQIANRRPVIPTPGLDAQDAYFGRTDATDQDVYYKGAWFLHTLRWAFRARLGEAAGERAFFRALRRVAYPDPAMESVTDGSQTHFATTADVRRVFEDELRAGTAGGSRGPDGSEVSLRDLFRLYLYQPTLPRLVAERDGGRLALRWETPEGYPLALPVEISVDGVVRAIPMPGGRAAGTVPEGATVVLDPNGWVLKAE